MSDQPIPKPNDEPHVIDIAIQMLEGRRDIGMATYKTPLQVGNGRDFGRDADEEMADWMIYWAGYRIENSRHIQRLLILIGKQQEEIKDLKRQIGTSVATDGKE